MSSTQKMTRAICLSVSEEALAIVESESKDRQRSRSATISQIVIEWGEMRKISKRGKR